MYRKFSLFLMVALVLVGGLVNYQTALATGVGGQGTATIDGSVSGGNVTVTKGLSHKFTVVLTIGASGITTDAPSPTFTIPADFTTPHIAGGAVVPTNANEVDVDGEWFVVGGTSCPVTMSSSGASGHVITVDVTTVCTVEPTQGKITLTYQGKSDVAMGPTALAIGTAVDNSATEVTPISAPPTITVTDTANITIQSALVYSSNTIRVNFNNPGGDITGVDFLKWHIDANAVYNVDGGGLTPLNPISATIISAGTPWTIELTFSGTPFLYPTTYYPAINGLYVDAGGVTAGGNTNAVVLHSDSIFITSKYLTIQSATIITSNKVKVELNYSQPALATVDVLKWHIDVNGGGVTPLEPTSAVITYFYGPRTIELTFPDNSFSDTSKFYSAATGLYVDAGGVTTVLDNSDTGDMTVHTNSVVPNSSSIAIDDGQKPIIISAVTGDINGVGLDKVTITFSEDMIGYNGTGFSITGTDSESKTILALGFPDGYSNKITFTLSSAFTDENPDATVTYDGTGTFTDTATLHNPLTMMASPNITDGIKPIVIVGVSDSLITVADTGSTFDVTLTFSEPMDTEVYPTISFSENVIDSGLLTFVPPSLGSWSDLNKIFTQQYTINGLISENFAGVNVTAEGGQDNPVGNIMDPYTAVDAFSVDTVPPTVSYIHTVGSATTSATSVDFSVKFSEDVTDVRTADFITGGTVTGPSITGVTATSDPSVYTVSVNTGTGNGTLWLDILGGVGVMDLTGNILTDNTSTSEIYTIKKSSGSTGGGYAPGFRLASFNSPALSGECKLGDLFSVVTGKSCPVTSITFPPIQTSCSIYGSTQELVKEKTRGINAKGVQKAINQIKAIIPSLVVDSIIGPLSEDGIINAQKILLVTVDGIWGPKTQQAYELFVKKQCPAV